MNNLKAEMARYGITVSDIQKVLGCTEKTARNKVNGKAGFSISEAFRIKNALFKGFSIDYLFAYDSPPEKKPA